MTSKQLREQVLDYWRHRAQSDLASRTGLHQDWLQFNEDVGRPISPVTNLPAPITAYQESMGTYRGRRTVTNKSNKVGVTELYLRLNIQRGTIGDCASYQILYGSSKEKMANENIQRTAEIFTSSPVLEPLLAEEPTNSYIKLTNGTEYIAIPRKVSSFRSWPRVKSIFLDEAAHYELIDDASFFAAALGRLSNTNGYLDVVSTPHGQRGYFYQIYTDAVAGKNNFKWWAIPYTMGVQAGLITDEFIEEARRSMSPALFAQEFECEFITASNAAIEPDLTKSMTEAYESE